jgi:glycosyltransferase involved in cell wall biosynthesis
VALIAEGCYPFLTGGVTTWCDQLVRGLTGTDFEVVAITGGQRQDPVVELPGNVVALTTVPLWGWEPAGRRPRRAVRAAFDAAYRPFLAAMLDDAVSDEAFLAALREMFRFARRHDLTAALGTDEALSALADTWRADPARDPLTLRELVEATELLDHFLRPLSAPLVRADVCHAVSNGLPALVAMAAKWAYGTPMIMSEHGVYLRERYLAFGTVRYPWAVKAVISALFRRMCAAAYLSSDLIAPVNVYNQRWEVRLGADPDVIATAYNGVDPQGCPPAGAEPTVPTIGWVGRIDPLKDLATLIDAFAVVHRELPEAVLRLFGPTPAGNEWYAERLHAQVDRIGLTDVIRFEGPVRPASHAYHASTVVALSSISEGLPYTVVEAMMCRRPTVSTDVGGVTEVVGDAGLTVPPRDPEAFAAACLELLTDAARRTDLADRGRERALRMFELQRMLGTFQDAYAGLATVPDPLPAGPAGAEPLPARPAGAEPLPAGPAGADPQPVRGIAVPGLPGRRESLAGAVQ